MGLGGSSSLCVSLSGSGCVGSYRLGSGGLSVSSGGSGSRLRGGVGLGAGLRSRLLGRRLLGFGGGIGSGLLAEVGLEVDDAVELGLLRLEGLHLRLLLSDVRRGHALELEVLDLQLFQLKQSGVLLL